MQSEREIRCYQFLALNIFLSAISDSTDFESKLESLEEAHGG